MTPDSLTADRIAEINAAADAAYRLKPGRPLAAETAEPVRRLLTVPQGRDAAA